MDRVEVWARLADGAGRLPREVVPVPVGERGVLRWSRRQRPCAGFLPGSVETRSTHESPLAAPLLTPHTARAWPHRAALAGAPPPFRLPGGGCLKATSSCWRELVFGCSLHARSSQSQGARAISRGSRLACDRRVSPPPAAASQSVHIATSHWHHGASCTLPLPDPPIECGLWGPVFMVPVKDVIIYDKEGRNQHGAGWAAKQT